MTTAGPCPEDLLVLERRWALSAAEERALSAHLATCDLCRMAAAIGRMVGPLPAVDGDDEEIAAKIVARTLAPRSVPMSERPPGAGLARQRPTGAPTPLGRRRQAPQRFWPAVAAASLLVASAASAAWWQLSASQRAVRERLAAATSPPDHRSPPHRPASLVPPTTLPAPEAPSQMQPPLPAPPSCEPVPRTVASKVAVLRSADLASAERTRFGRPRSVAGVGAGALFLEANHARRAGQVSEAIRLYRSLQVSFPGSPEAQLSFLSLGDLYLYRGTLRDALAQFDAYLQSGDTALAEEALVSRARVLARLGRSADEQAEWEALLSRYPQSDYRWRAQQRIDELATRRP